MPPEVTKAMSYHMYVMENYYQLAVVIVCLCLLLYLGGQARRQRKHRREREASERTLYEVLHLALKSHCRVFIKPHDSAVSLREVRALMKHVDKERVVFWVTGAHLSHAWVGQGVNVFFFVKVGHKFAYYNFNAVLNTVEKSSQGLLVTVKPTGLLLLGQRRNLLRFRPATRLVHSLDLRWTKPHACTEGAASERPATQWKALAQNCFVLKDISAGGMRLHVKKSFVSYCDLAEGDHMLVALKLVAAKTGRIIEVATVGSCLSVTETRTDDGTESCKAVGIVFRKHTVSRDTEGKVVWRDVNPQEGVPSMVNWVVQSQFEMVRQVR